MRTKFLLLFSCIASLLISHNAWSHHSTANYDHSAKVLVEGTVTKFKWTNPHSWLYVSVPTEGGGEEEWAIECGSVAQLLQNDWARDDIQPGDHVRIVAWIARDGTRHGEMHSIVTDDNKTLLNSVGY